MLDSFGHEYFRPPIGKYGLPNFFKSAILFLINRNVTMLSRVDTSAECEIGVCVCSLTPDVLNKKTSESVITYASFPFWEHCECYGQLAPAYQCWKNHYKFQVHWRSHRCLIFVSHPLSREFTYLLRG